MIPEVYWSIVHFLLGNALGGQISDAWFPPFLVSDGGSINLTRLVSETAPRKGQTKKADFRCSAPATLLCVIYVET